MAPEKKPTDGDDDDEEDDGDKEDDTCFVATAAYGSPSHPDVVALRAFRDNVLAKNAAGRAFILVYCRVGPKLARFTRPDQFHAAAARWLLTRICRMVAPSRIDQRRGRTRRVLTNSAARSITRLM